LWRKANVLYIAGHQHLIGVVMATNYCDTEDFNLSTWETVAAEMQVLLEAAEMPEEEAEPETSETISGYVNNDGVRIYYEVEGQGR
jgi:hypothetical protein